VKNTRHQALIICNGEAPGKKLAARLARGTDLIVAADGGANVARTLGIRPDVIIGDLDSMTKETRRFFSRSIGKRLKPFRGFSVSSDPRPKGGGYTQFIRVSRQDNTDLEKALDFLLRERINRATIIAATGNRLDHTLGNLSVIWRYATQMDLMFVGDGWVALPVGKRKTLSARVGTTISLIPFGTCAGITLRGLQYPLTNATMNVGEIGVSNVVTKPPFSVEVKEGHMLLIVLAGYSSIKLLR
jgi:thiamine pyrophosphokinase